MKIITSSHLRSLSWSKILLISIFTTLSIVVLELLLEWILVNSYEIYVIRETLYSDGLGRFLMLLIVALGEGALAVYIGEQWLLKIVFNTFNLGALVLCLYLGLFVKYWLAIPSKLMDISDGFNIYEFEFIDNIPGGRNISDTFDISIEMVSVVLFGIALGVFLRGKRY